MNRIEQNASPEANITKTLDQIWFDQAQIILGGGYTSAEEKQFLNDTLKTLVENNKHTFDHPYTPIEYAVTRKIAVDALAQKYPSECGLAQDLIAKTVGKFGAQWQEEKPDINVFGWLVISCIQYLSQRGMPLEELNFPIPDACMNTDLTSVPDVIHFVEGADKSAYNTGVNEQHEFLADRIKLYLAAAEQTGHTLPAEPLMAIATRFAFGGEESRPWHPSTPVPTSEKILDTLLDSAIKQTKPEDLANLFFGEVDSFQWQFFRCKSVYQKMEAALGQDGTQKLRGHKGPDVRPESGRGPRS